MDQPEFLELQNLWGKVQGLEWPVNELSLKPIATVAITNIRRVVSLGVLPTQMFSLGSEYLFLLQQAWLIKDTQKQGEFIKKRLAGAKPPEIPTIMTPRGYPMVMENFCMASCGEAFAMLMSSQVVGMWTAFETFAGDLWEASLNAYPYLAIKQGGKVSIGTMSRLTQGKFDLNHRMGTLLSLEDKYNFTRLEDIRLAYANVFDEHAGKIKAALVDKALDALKAVRNLIVHKSGKADIEYLGEKKNAPSIPKLELGQQLDLNGMLTASLITPAIECMGRLITAVDQWIVAHKQRDSI